VGAGYQRYSYCSSPTQILIYLGLVEGVTPTDAPDQVIWRWTKDGGFSTASAYRAFFSGQHAIPGAKLLRKTRGPKNASFSYGWCYITDAGQLQEGDMG
jgi:hypothetical protein